MIEKENFKLKGRSRRWAMRKVKCRLQQSVFRIAESFLIWPKRKTLWRFEKVVNVLEEEEVGRWSILNKHIFPPYQTHSPKDKNINNDQVYVSWFNFYMIYVFNLCHIDAMSYFILIRMHHFELILLLIFRLSYKQIQCKMFENVFIWRNLKFGEGGISNILD